MIELLLAGCLLGGTVAVGLLAHESAHATVLRLAGIEYTVSYSPGRDESRRGHPWAVVRPSPTGREPPWHLRIAALSPALLALPAFAVGVVGGPWLDSPLVTAVIVGWLACSIPSPQDFSVAFYAHRALERDPADGGGSRAD